MKSVVTTFDTSRPNTKASASCIMSKPSIYVQFRRRHQPNLCNFSLDPWTCVESIQYSRQSNEIKQNKTKQSTSTKNKEQKNIYKPIINKKIWENT